MSDIEWEKKGVGRVSSFGWVRIRIYILQIEKHGNKILAHTLNLADTPYPCTEMLPGRLNAWRMPVVPEYLLFGSDLSHSSKALLRNCPESEH